MTLAEVVIDIADHIEKTLPNCSVDVLEATIRGYCRELRTAAKLTPAFPEIKPAPAIKRDPLKETFEESGESMYELVGGPDAGTYVSLDPHMKIGQKPVIAGEVYCKEKDGRLYHDQDATNQYRAQLEGR